MNYINSNMLPREELAQFGVLSEATAEKIIDQAEQLEEVLEIEGYIAEAKSQFVDEDFLEPVLKLLKNLHRNLRKSDTKEAVQFIIDEAEDLQGTIARASEYGADELNKALKQIGG